MCAETYTGLIPQPMHVIKVTLALSTQSYFTIAIAAIHRSTTARFKGYFGVFPTLGASRGEHLAYRLVAVIAIAVATVSVLPCFPLLAT